MRADTATQTAATLFLSALMTAALMIGGHIPLPSGLARVPSVPFSDSYDVLRVPLRPADLLAGETGAKPTPPRTASAAAEITMRPAIGTSDEKPSSNAARGVLGARLAAIGRQASDVALADRVKDDRIATGHDRRGTPSPRQEDRPRSGKPTEPTRPDRGGNAAQDTHGRGRSSAGGTSAKGRGDARPARTSAASTSLRVDRPAPRRDSDKPGAGHGGRPSDLRKPDRADRGPRRAPGK